MKDYDKLKNVFDRCRRDLLEAIVILEEIESHSSDSLAQNQAAIGIKKLKRVDKDIGEQCGYK